MRALAVTGFVRDPFKARHLTQDACRDLGDRLKAALPGRIHAFDAGWTLRMWEEYFPAATIVGLDIRREVLFTAGRVQCHYADQGCRQSLLDAVAAAGGGPFDLIIDDGSHEDHHQITTAEALLPLLAPGGVFVIEDITVDCRPDLLAERIHLPPGFGWRAVECGIGIGKARCRPGCEFCGGLAGESLIVFERQP
ncbi:MAG: class I SAM-dependent methyltransferase [Planctomycetes bacterium]|nr:class I SAM-dependent methyltransferase [Planctomycetota bacterium]